VVDQEVEYDTCDHGGEQHPHGDQHHAGAEHRLDVGDLGVEAAGE
jgi:hypothetical protein